VLEGAIAWAARLDGPGPERTSEETEE